MKKILQQLKFGSLHHHALSAYSLLEVIVALTIFGTVLMMAATSLLEGLAHQKELQQYSSANRLAQNLMETLLALPAKEAKNLVQSLTDEDNKILSHWTENGKYQLKTSWKEDSISTNLIHVFVEYDARNKPLIQLSTIRRTD